MKRVLSFFSVALFALMAIFAPAHAEDVIKIGVAGPHTGDLAPFGVPTVHAVKIVAEKYNAKVAFLAKRLKLLFLMINASQK